MSIADKLGTIYENEQRYAILNDSLERRLNGEEIVGESYYDAFWDTLQLNGTRRQYGSTFGYAWNDALFKPKYPFHALTDCSNMFYYADISEINITHTGKFLFLASSSSTFSDGFYGSSIQKILVDIDASLSINNYVFNETFRGCSRLKTIQKII
uniref:hypothetical protein n=1 Tax=Massilibacteroides sp. TaxID=2034766 RepID=UPI0026160F66